MYASRYRFRFRIRALVRVHAVHRETIERTLERIDLGSLSLWKEVGHKVRLDRRGRSFFYSVVYINFSMHRARFCCSLRVSMQVSW